MICSQIQEEWNHVRTQQPDSRAPSEPPAKMASLEQKGEWMLGASKPKQFSGSPVR